MTVHSGYSKAGYDFLVRLIEHVEEWYIRLNESDSWTVEEWDEMIDSINVTLRKYKESKIDENEAAHEILWWVSDVL